jgi:TfoX/Sxy family transcriptional regulator of competence genes
VATQRKTVDSLLAQLERAGFASAKTMSNKMFGEYGLYLDKKLFAIMCDDQLFLKPTKSGREYALDLPERAPYPGAKPHLLVSSDRWHDADWLLGLVSITVASLPVPTKRGTLA